MSITALDVTQRGTSLKDKTYYDATGEKDRVGAPLLMAHNQHVLKLSAEVIALLSTFPEMREEDLQQFRLYTDTNMEGWRFGANNEFSITRETGSSGHSWVTVELPPNSNETELYKSIPVHFVFGDDGGPYAYGSLTPRFLADVQRDHADWQDYLDQHYSKSFDGRSPLLAACCAMDLVTAGDCWAVEDLLKGVKEQITNGSERLHELGPDNNSLHENSLTRIS